MALATVVARCIERKRGDTVPDEIALTDEDGSALDLTGMTVTLTINREEDPVNTDNQLVSITGTVASPASSGIVQFSWSSIQADQTPDTYYFDIQLITAGGLIKTVEKGEYQFTQDITK